MRRKPVPPTPTDERSVAFPCRTRPNEDLSFFVYPASVYPSTTTSSPTYTTSSSAKTILKLFPTPTPIRTQTQTRVRVRVRVKMLLLLMDRPTNRPTEPGTVEKPKTGRFVFVWGDELRD